MDALLFGSPDEIDKLLQRFNCVDPVSDVSKPLSVRDVSACMCVSYMCMHNDMHSDDTPLSPRVCCGQEVDYPRFVHHLMILD